MTDEEAGETLPKFMWIPAGDVAKAAVDGLAAGRAVVIPGSVNRAAAGLAHLAPKALILPLMVKCHPVLKPDPSAEHPVTALRPAPRRTQEARGRRQRQRRCPATRPTSENAGIARPLRSSWSEPPGAGVGLH